MDNEKEFDIEYYFAIIDRFHSLSIDFELVGDKFFAMQSLAGEITEEEAMKIEQHPMYLSCEKKLETIAKILEKIK